MSDDPRMVYGNILTSINKFAATKKQKTGQDIKDEVSLRLRAYRAAHNLTIEDLAKKLGVNRMQVMRWEARKNRPSPLAVQKMKGIGVDIST